MVRLMCRGCDAEIERRAGRGRPKAYCSESCRPARARTYRSRHAVPVGSEIVSVCRGCGGKFSQAKAARGRPFLYCSTACIASVAEKYSRDRYAGGLAPHLCAHCGATFLAAPRKRMQRYCSAKCGNEPRRAYPDLLSRRRAEEHRRRARVRGSAVERFCEIDVFERDGWVCGICREPVDQNLRHPDHYAASLDHVIPLARGGSHTPENCQCSHWICNSRKSDTVIFCEAV